MNYLAKAVGAMSDGSARSHTAYAASVTLGGVVYWWVAA